MVEEMVMKVTHSGFFGGDPEIAFKKDIHIIKKTFDYIVAKEEIAYYQKGEQSFAQKEASKRR